MLHVSPQDFEVLVSEAVETVPETFRPYLSDLVVDIEEEPDQRTCEHLGLRDRRELLGLYHGRPLTERSVEELVRWPERIVIYRRNILRICRNRRQVVRQVRKTVLHEVGHHFGLSEEDLRKHGYG